MLRERTFPPVSAGRRGWRRVSSMFMICPEWLVTAKSAATRKASRAKGGVLITRRRERGRVAVDENTVPKFKIQKTPATVRCAGVATLVKFEQGIHKARLNELALSEAAIREDARELFKQRAAQPRLHRSGKSFFSAADDLRREAIFHRAAEQILAVEMANF